MMELIVISREKLKIMLTPPDMRHYELTAAEADSTDEHTRRAFRHILSDARDRSGFDTTGEKILLQMYACREGGCEIFVTKLGASEGNTSAEKRPLTAPEEALWRCVMEREETYMNVDTAPRLDTAHRSSPNATMRTVAVSFPHLNHLLQVCRRLKDLDYTGESAAYIEEGTDAPAYLFLQVPDSVFRRRLPDRYAFLCEYGDTTEPELLRLYLGEHGRLLCEGNAVDVLCDLG